MVGAFGALKDLRASTAGSPLRVGVRFKGLRAAGLVLHKFALSPTVDEVGWESCQS